MGERAVVNHLKRKGYVLKTMNYRKKWGEIDIIMQKGDIVHFIEVKTVSYGTRNGVGGWLPEENVHPKKLEKLFRTIETWCMEYAYEGEWQLDVAAVHIDEQGKRGTIKLIENVAEA